MRTRRSRWWWLLALALFVALSGSDGCSDRGEPYAPVSGPRATSPTAAIAQLRSAYFRVDLAAVDGLLHPDFTFTYSVADADSLGLSGTWDRATEMELTTNMFSGQPGVRLSGVPQPPLDLDNAFDNIQLIPLPDDRGWVPVRSGPLRGSLRRRFQANYTAQFEELDSDFVMGVNEFWLVDHPIVGRYGEIYPRYQILHWQDYGVDSLPGKHQTISWARLKAKFATLE